MAGKDGLPDRLTIHRWRKRLAGNPLPFIHSLVEWTR